jgi:hypothetical protein
LHNGLLRLIEVVEGHELDEVAPSHASSLIALAHGQAHGVKCFITKVPVQSFKGGGEADLDGGFDAAWEAAGGEEQEAGGKEQEAGGKTQKAGDRR